MRKLFITIPIFIFSLSSCLYASDFDAKKAPDDINGQGRISIYESVRPAPVRKPDKMHVGRKTSGDMSIAVGDVMINPIPNTGRR